MTELSKDLITHKLKIKGEGIKYIPKRIAEDIFKQLSDQSKNSIVIVNPNNLTYITKYRSDIELIPLTEENKDLEDLLYISGLTEFQKNAVREMKENRESNYRKKATNKIIEQMIKKIKGEL